MDFSAVFDISAAGMNFERMRLEATASNLANAQTTAGPDGAYRPLRAIAASGMPESFDLRLAAALPRPLGVSVVPSSAAPRLVLDPGHPAADARGFVAYPDVSPVSEMVRLVEIGRAYEANVRALAMARSMALKALEIGSDR